MKKDTNGCIAYSQFASKRFEKSLTYNKFVYVIKLKRALLLGVNSYDLKL